MASQSLPPAPTTDSFPALVTCALRRCYASVYQPCGWRRLYQQRSEERFTIMTKLRRDNVLLAIQQRRPSHRGNEAEIFIIPILGGKLVISGGKQLFLSI